MKISEKVRKNKFSFKTRGKFQRRKAKNFKEHTLISLIG